MTMKTMRAYTVFSGLFFSAAPVLAGTVTYERFGAAGDGKTDDQAAIVAAHAAANAKGVPVRAGDGKTYYIGGGDAVAEIRTDVDFGTAKFVIDDVNVKNRRAPLFRVVGDKRPFAVKGVRKLARGQKNIGVRLPSACLLIAENDKVRRYIRFGPNRNDGYAQREVILVGRDGAVDPRAPVVWDFEEITSLTAYPVDPRTLVIKGGEFVTIANRGESKYLYYERNIRVQRSNVRIEGLRHYVTGERDHGSPYAGFLAIEKCADVLVTNCLFTAHRTYTTIGSAGTPVSMGSYDLNVGSAVNVSFVGCRQTTDIMDGRYWGIIGSNYSKNLLYDGCSFSRFDAHMGVANATIRNSRLGYMGINAIGFGTFLVENSTVCTRNFINLRSDYGSTWEGEFVFRNCTHAPRVRSGGFSPALVGGSYSGKHDFGYPCHMPKRIVVDGLRIEDGGARAGYGGPFVFGEFNRHNRGPGYVETYPYRVTEEVVLRNVTTASGKPLRVSPNRWMFRDVTVVRE